MKFLPNLTFLSYFVTAAESKSISKAAKTHFVSQSAVSQAISKLELALGKQLISHEQNRFSLTPDGCLLLEKSKQILMIFSEICDSFNETDGIYRGKLSIACTHSFALSLLPRYLGELSENWQYIEPVLRLGHTGSVVEIVKRGDVDLGIVLDNDDFSAFESFEIYSGKHNLYCAKGMQPESPYKFIVTEEKREVSVLKRHLEAQQLENVSFIEVSSWEVIANLAENRMGIGFIPDYVAGRKSLEHFELSLPFMPYKILAIYNRQRRLSRNSKLFIDLINKSNY